MQEMNADGISGLHPSREHRCLLGRVEVFPLVRWFFYFGLLFGSLRNFICTRPKLCSGRGVRLYNFICHMIEIAYTSVCLSSMRDTADSCEKRSVSGHRKPRPNHSGGEPSVWRTRARIGKRRKLAALNNWDQLNSALWSLRCQCCRPIHATLASENTGSSDRRETLVSTTLVPRDQKTLQQFESIAGTFTTFNAARGRIAKHDSRGSTGSLLRLCPWFWLVCSMSSYHCGPSPSRTPVDNR